MGDDDVLVVEAESSVEESDDGVAPYVQFCSFGEDLVRCEVSSNAYLAPHHVIDEAGAQVLETLGWAAPTCTVDEEAGEGSANYFTDSERSEADRLAVMTVRALRDVFGVLHPMFLSADNLETDAAVPESAAVDVDPDEPVATRADDHDHLLQLVEAALEPMFGRPMTKDDDGDFPLVIGSAMVFVRVETQAPVVHLFAELVSEVEDLERAAFEVAVLNRDLRMLKFVLLEDRVFAHLHLPAQPFAPEHLQTMVALMCETVDRVDDDLVARVGGRRALEDSDGFSEPDEDEPDEDQPDEDQPDDEPHPAMLTLLQLDAESPGSIDPELAASICGMDRDLVLELIMWNEEQEVAWRESGEAALSAGDPDEEADGCDIEMQHAARTVTLLRRALRVVVERELGREPTVPSSAEPARRTHTKRPGR